ncbi:MAG: hypothetical protein L6R41_002634 [Letrouitia leprolyta]|nr:MAG: hypothetical protein L6R41_002634 [Letrouitia leprolyta]
MHAVWHLKVSKARKRLITMTFMLGGIVSIISTVRLPYVRSFEQGDDPAYNDVLTAELSALEIGIGTLAACLPIYRPIYNRYFCTTTSADCGNQDPKTYGQLLEEQSSIKMKMRLIGKPSNQNATSVHTISEANSKAEPSQSTTIRLKKIPHPMDEESGTGIMVTKEFVVTGPAPSSSIAQCQDSFCCK